LPFFFFAGFLFGFGLGFPFPFGFHSVISGPPLGSYNPALLGTRVFLPDMGSQLIVRFIQADGNNVNRED
jgi:hypothetical protein